MAKKKVSKVAKMHKKAMEQRAKDIADYIIENDATIRDAANHFNISKTTVHLDITVRLQKISIRRYKKIQKIIAKHTERRAYNGGVAVQAKRRIELLQGGK